MRSIFVLELMLAPTCDSHCTACKSEQDAMGALGYTQASLDNLSGKELQPWSSIKYWASLTNNERTAARILGYTQITWDDRFGKAIRPESSYKFWDELQACGEGTTLNVRPYASHAQ